MITPERLRLIRDALDSDNDPLIVLDATDVRDMLDAIPTDTRGYLLDAVPQAQGGPYSADQATPRPRMPDDPQRTASRDTTQYPNERTTMDDLSDDTVVSITVATTSP